MPLLSASLLQIALVVIGCGVLLWLVNAYIPMEGMIKRVLNIVVVVGLVVWLTRAFGLWDYMAGVKV